jgi:hypothetical protein
MISLRIRADEHRQAIAKQCGTSVEMLERSYSFAIEISRTRVRGRLRMNAAGLLSLLLAAAVVAHRSRKRCAR